MAKDILLYGSIWEYMAVYFFDQIKEAMVEDEDAELTLRINCPGGSPEFGWSIITKLQEIDNLSILVDGQAHSMAAFMLCYVDSAEGVDTSQYLFHRAAYPKWVESSEQFADSIQAQNLNKINKSLEKAFRAKADVAAFENLPQLKEKNITVKSIFSMEDRAEVLLTAADMKKIGLIKSIRKITPTKAAEMNAMMEEFNECSSLSQFRAAAEKITDKKTDKPSNNNTMTLEELQAKHPELYAQVKESAKKEGTEEGTKAEKDRVEAWMQFADVDPEAVQKGIESGEQMAMKDIAKFTKLGIQKNALGKLDKDSPDDVTTEEDDNKPKSEKDKELEEFDKKVDAELKNHKWV